jgi:hypothetical protein
MFNILEEAGAKLRMRPMAVTHVNKFVKCVHTNFNYLILGRHVIELKKIVNFIKIIVINLMEGAQCRTNIWFALCK